MFSARDMVEIVERRRDKKRENCFMVIPRTVLLFQQNGYTNERIESARMNYQKKEKNEEKKNNVLSGMFASCWYSSEGK